jgi:hypothetical protein
MAIVTDTAAISTPKVRQKRLLRMGYFTSNL